MTPRFVETFFPPPGSRALPGPFSNRWWLSLVYGFLSALALYLFGKAAVDFHDNYWLPLLFHGLLGMPTRWVVSGVLMFLLAWRADVPSVRGMVAAFFSGIWLGILLFYDLWYYYPFLVAVWAGFLAWRAGWNLWSYPGGSVAMWVVGLAVFLGAAFSFDALSWDNRFTVGASARFNATLTSILLGAAAAALLAAIYGLVRLGLSPRPPRPPLVDLIEQEPRMTRYLDAVRILTGNRMKNGSPTRARLRAVVSNLPPWWEDGGIFGGNNDGPAPAKTGVAPWLRALKGSARRLQWMAGFSLLKVPFVPVFSRFFRTPLMTPGMRCEALSRLLYEGVEREFGQWCAARSGAAFLHFARGVALREALVETRVYFGRGVGEWNIADEARRLHQAFFARGAEPVVTIPPDAGWAEAEREYEQLWVQNCERLFLVRGDKFTLPLLGPDDLLDPDAIRVALKDRSTEAAWVVDRLRAGGRLGQLGLDPAGTPEETARLQLVDALNWLIDQASAPRPAGLRAYGQQAGAPSNRRAEMLRIRAELGTTFGAALASINDMVDLNTLSVNWMVSRLASGGPVSLHRAACHLALAVFALEMEDPALAASISDDLCEKYLRLHGGGSPALARAANTPEDKTDAARCNLLCALWQAHLGHWLQAARLMATGLLDVSQDHVTEPILRAIAHLHAALLQGQHRSAGAAAGQLENEIDSLLRQFDALDSRKQEKPLLPMRIPGHVLAREFAARLGVDFDSNP
jgi:hypothetical protein